VRALTDLEEALGFRSSFNFVPERYPLDRALMQDLRERGFEIGVHGLKHDGKLFSSKQRFEERAGRINDYLQEFGAVGFRAPLTHRNPEWMQALNIDYDLSFFDTDPYEPIPGGAMSIWPFMIGHFVELPYTLVQDCTLFNVLGQANALSSPRLVDIWLKKVDFLEQYCGMALLNAHPDYLYVDDNLEIYKAFLQAMLARGGYWLALPHQVSNWWRERTGVGTTLWVAPTRIKMGVATLNNGSLVVNLLPDARQED
jgi:peptidoglycan/xylan/chitin deacetylase (PgdA/CDA1 family)